MTSELVAFAADGLHDDVVDFLHHALPSGSRVVDLGAGTGALSLRLNDAGFETVAADWLAENFRVPQVPFFQIDLDSRDGLLRAFPPGSERVLVACEVIEHLKYPWRFIETCAEILAEDGILLVTTPNIVSRLSRINILINGVANGFGRLRKGNGHISPLFPTQLEDMYAAAGLELFALQPVGGRSRFMLREASFRGLAQLGLALSLGPLMRGRVNGTSVLAAGRKRHPGQIPLDRPPGTGEDGSYGVCRRPEPGTERSKPPGDSQQ